jgi:hypothetical protein
MQIPQRTLQCHTILCNTLHLQCRAIKYYTLHCNTIPHNTIQYHTIQYPTIPHNTIQCHAMPYNTLQYHTIPYNTIQYQTIPYNTIQYDTILPLLSVKYVSIIWHETNGHAAQGSYRAALGSSSPTPTVPS